MIWIESSPYFCVALETARDAAEQHFEPPLRSMNMHKFLTCTQGTNACQALPKMASMALPNLQYLVEVYRRLHMIGNHHFAKTIGSCSEWHHVQHS